ncbi:MAG TPA: hypothetical protein PLO62_07370 [Candidatus Hydrogenedentes bacterium]|nr:hypothetical protein [Candidatus Hydrogenedentota bacterium]
MNQKLIKVLLLVAVIVIVGGIIYKQVTAEKPQTPSQAAAKRSEEKASQAAQAAPPAAPVSNEAFPPLTAETLAGTEHDLGAYVLAFGPNGELIGKQGDKVIGTGTYQVEGDKVTLTAQAFGAMKPVMQIQGKGLLFNGQAVKRLK